MGFGNRAVEFENYGECVEYAADVVWTGWWFGWNVRMGTIVVVLECKNGYHSGCVGMQEWVHSGCIGM